MMGAVILTVVVIDIYTPGHWKDINNGEQCNIRQDDHHHGSITTGSTTGIAGMDTFAGKQKQLPMLESSR